MWTFCDDTQKREFHVPLDLFRVADLRSSIKTTQLMSGIGARTRSRCAVDVIGDGCADQQASCYYEAWWALRQGRPFLIAAGSALTAATHLRCRARHPLKAP
jgi:hypothetical protein